MPSFEEDNTLSDSLSLSSYSSRLLPLALGGRVPTFKCKVEEAVRRLLRVVESYWTRRPVVTTSSVADECEDDDGREDISIQESGV